MQHLEYGEPKSVNLASVGDCAKIYGNVCNVWCILINALEQLRAVNWSVWTFFKPHLAATGTEKTAGGRPVTVDCLQTTCWKSLNSTQWADGAKLEASESGLWRLW